MKQSNSICWYQERWVWFNLLLLSLAICAASLMSYIAMQHSPAEIGERWYKDGALMKQQRHQEMIVNQIKLRGSLHVTPTNDITFTMQSEQHDAKLAADIYVPQLTLYIEHPTRPAEDQEIILKLGKNNQYTGKLHHAVQGKRRLLVSPAYDKWYLTAAGYFPLSNDLVFSPDMS